MNPQTGKYLVVFGITIAVIGLIIYFFHDTLKWLGRLPGDIRIEKENFKFYFPVVTMLLLSLLLTIIANFFRKF